MKSLYIVLLAIVFLFSLGAYIDFLNHTCPDNPDPSSGWDMLHRTAGHQIVVTDAAIGGTGSQIVNVFEFTGTVRILDQYAVVTEVTTLTNLTGMYATIYDGTVSTDLTSDGAVLSGAPVGTFFTKDGAAVETYSVLFADQARSLEPPSKKKNFPFLINAKNGATNYVRFHYTTTDNPVNFKMSIYFVYELINGATLTVVS